nr:gag protein [Human immunodeficiency virus 1]
MGARASVEPGSSLAD